MEELDVLPAAAVDFALTGDIGKAMQNILVDTVLVGGGAVLGSVIVEKTPLTRVSPAVGGLVEVILGGFVALVAGKKSRALAMVGIGCAADGLRRFVRYIL